MRRIVKKNHIAVFLGVLAFLLGIAFIPKGSAATTITEIHNVDDLVNCMKHSKDEITYQHEYRLMTDITLTPEDIQKLKDEDVFSFGSMDNPFMGVFEGNGHTISGFTHKLDELELEVDTGLFVRTEGAVIRNLTIDDAWITADNCGGILAGEAVDTVFENITIKNSYIRVSCADNVLTLVTDGGLVGGALAGQTDGCVLYNCESINTHVNNNNTEGVEAAGGKGLYLGGLVGRAENTLIEYCRVTGDVIHENGEVEYKSKVTSSYGTAVGALGGNTIYVGGIAGEMSRGTKVVDCFATPYVYFYAATYVAVGAGTTGHAGGIAAAVYGKDCEIIRSHYAGVMESKQYNAVLVIPIIQNNVGLSGIADKADNKWETEEKVMGTYFKQSVTGENVNTIENDEVTSEYGPQTDERYIDKTFWEGHDYDFAGTVARIDSIESENGMVSYDEYLESEGRTPEHVNKWVMDYVNGYPVHGKSVAATLDYPNAGEVTIGASDLVHESISKTDPYKFAVQAINFNEMTVDLGASANPGYQFVGWYKVPDVTAISLPEDHSYFDEIFASTEPDYKVSGALATYENAPCEDNDLFIARYQAKVQFHNVNGDVITSEMVQDVGDNWYYYKEALPNIVPTDPPAGGVNDPRTFIGWTTVKSNEEGGSYRNIENSDLADLTAKGAFYKAGDEVVEPLELYPVYKGLLGNVFTEIEGHDADRLTLRTGVGSTRAEMDENGRVIIHMTGVGENGSLPDGYRFLGWYENGHRISTEVNYMLDEDVDLTVEHTYVARFEYRVDYYVRAFQTNGKFEDELLLASLWQEYDTPFVNLQPGSFHRENILHWGITSAKDDRDHTHDSDGGAGCDLAYSGIITKPVVVYSHNFCTQTISGYATSVDSDFPTAGNISATVPDGATSQGHQVDYHFTFNDEGRYLLQFWTVESSHSGKHWTYYAENPRNINTSDLEAASNMYSYKGRAMITAKVRFYDKSGVLKKEVTRRHGSYESYDNSANAAFQNYILQDSDKVHTYRYPFFATSAVVSESTIDGKTISSTVKIEASPSNSEMHVDGYHFLGWINASDVSVGSDEWNYIYDVERDSYCTSDIRRAEPYLVTADDLVTEAHDLYPVYAKYNVETTTNLAEEGIVTDGPHAPTYTYTEDGTGKRILTFTADHSKDTVYRLISVVYEKNGGDRIVIPPNEDGTYTLEIEAGPYYKIIANYDSLVCSLTYHVNTGEVQTETRTKGDVVGAQPVPEFQLNSGDSEHFVFMGWTAKEPEESEYYRFDSYEQFTASAVSFVSPNAIVMKSMELWSVFVKTSAEVTSNIDNKGTAHRQLIVPENTDGAWIAKAEKTVTYGSTEYSFIRWEDKETHAELSVNPVYILEKKDLYANKKLEAIYQEVVTSAGQIRYHGTDGEVLYTVTQLRNRNTFVNRNEVDGKTIFVPIDVEAFVLIQETLESNETFWGWQWVIPPNEENPEEEISVTLWEEFYDKDPKTLMQESNLTVMDIYPIVREVTAKDSKGESVVMNVGATKDTAENGNVTEKVTVGLDTEYTQHILTVHVEDLSYGTKGTAGEVAVTTPAVGVPVELYIKRINPETGLMSDVLIDTVPTDEKGNAVFELQGRIVIEKTTEDGNDDQIFLFDIYKKTDAADGSEEEWVKIQTVGVPAQGSVVVKVSFGEYRVKENMDWAWRYSESSGGQDVKVLTKEDCHKLVFSNKKVNEKWFDFSTHEKNTYPKTEENY